MQLYRIMKTPDAYGLDNPYYIEKQLRPGLLGGLIPARWVQMHSPKGFEYFATVTDAKAAIEQYVAKERVITERLRSRPTIVAWGHVAHNGIFYPLRDDDGGVR